MRQLRNERVLAQHTSLTHLYEYLATTLYINTYMFEHTHVKRVREKNSILA